MNEYQAGIDDYFFCKLQQNIKCQCKCHNLVQHATNLLQWDGTTYERTERGVNSNGIYKSVKCLIILCFCREC